MSSDDELRALEDECLAKARRAIADDNPNLAEQWLIVEGAISCSIPPRGPGTRRPSVHPRLR